MKLIVSKDEIQQKLSNIQNIVEKRNTMPILSHFLLEAGKNGSYIIATDLETALKEPLSIKVEKEGRICIPARKMFEIVREVDTELICESVDDQWLKIKTGASNFRLACLSAKEFPAWPGMEDMEEIDINAKILTEVIDKTVYAAGESDTRYTLNGILFHVVPGGKLNVVGTDGHRLAMTSKTIEGTVKEERKNIIPRKAAVELRKLLDKSEENIKVTFCKNHVMFSIGDIQFLTRLIEGTYPNYEQVIPSGNEKKVVIQKDSFVKTLRRVSIMSKERSNAVRLDLSDNLVVITSSSPDMGEAQDELAVNYSGETLSMGFNARYLIDILAAMSSENIILEMQAALSPVLVKDEKDEGYRCVIMPMRI
ncbi:MAG: DNA polymerase III subunit beta [Nitrospiraceae bacterium]|jgi:DNA polymerase III subunit beta|nr:MAG: DNA polymerase III subunit beta [Nitrospiraceae bacterium]